MELSMPWKLRWYGGSLNRPKGKREDGSREDQTTASRAALSTHTKTLFWACARSSLRPRTPSIHQDTLERPQYCIRKILERIAQQLEGKRKGST